MPEELKVWRIEGGEDLREIPRSPLDFEKRLEDWLERDIGILDRRLLVIGRQVPTDFGGFIDLLCLDDAGDVVVVELKRDKSPRDVTAQVLDYGSWVNGLSNADLTRMAGEYFARRKLHNGTLEDAFTQRFQVDLPDTLNGSHRLVVVASEVDAASERIIKYLSEVHGVNINAATFQYLRDSNGEFLARAFLLEPAEVERQNRNRGTSKRSPNLTYEELERIADEKGVMELYRRTVGGLERHLQKHTTRSSIVFTAILDESRKAVIGLIPEKSSAADGLRFRVYSRRLQTWSGLPAEGMLALLPARRERWIYYENAGPDFEGFEGFFGNTVEVDRFLSGIVKA